ncbi:sugar kinase [Leucobacter insecticola]|uniref:Sugar kinase n=1 Tax=Leucobacter insecticola TaxID=2714934 RepID=A0A6G8FIG9_9MICO|nr:FGGY-family carbohydrate kinase [Leucobacter insecticola]QIM16165.1 sugar kinase [Leucobacter insecticola]
MAKKYLIGIDGGSQSTKVVIFDTEGSVVCESSEKLAPMHTPGAGVVEHPDDDLFTTLVSASSRTLRKFTDDHGGNLADIVGVGLCTIRCCRALVRSDGMLAAPVQSWMDIRLSKPYEHESDDVAYVTTTSGYLMGRITGSFTDTAANYIGPWPMDVRTWDWFTDPEAFAAWGIPRDMLYTLQKPGDIGGYVTAEFAAATGIPAGLPVVHTANDKAAEALGAGLRDEKAALVSLGTYITAMVVGSNVAESPQAYFTNFASEPDRYMYESAGIRRGMWTVSWLRNLVGAEVTQGAAELGIGAEEYLNLLAAKVPAGSDGLMCVLDWLASPSQPHKKGMFIGFDERHGYAHMYRSILEGIAFRMRQNVAEMEAELGTRIEKLVISGGGANSDVCMQIFADVFNVPAARNEMRGAAGLGAAICAAVACGIYPDFDVATSRMSREAEVFTPNPANTGLYAELGEVYADISSQTDALLERTSQILSHH